MYKIGLSGNRFSGKDTVCDLFRKISIPVFDADVIIKFMINYDFTILEKTRVKLGDNYITKDFSINLKKVDEDGKFGQLLSILEPDLFRSYQKFEDRNRGSIYTIFNCSVLYETKWYDKMYKNINVYSPFIHRVDRAKKVLKGQYHQRSSINKLLSNEACELEKNKIASYIIHNYNVFNIEKQVNNIDQKIIDEYLLSCRRENVNQPKWKPIFN